VLGGGSNLVVADGYTVNNTVTVKLHDIAEFRPYGREGGHVLTTIGRIIYNDRIERALEEALGDEFDPKTYVFVNQSMKKRDTTRLIDMLAESAEAMLGAQIDIVEGASLQHPDAGAGGGGASLRCGAIG